MPDPSIDWPGCRAADAWKAIPPVFSTNTPKLALTMPAPQESKPVVTLSVAEELDMRKSPLARRLTT